MAKSRVESQYYSLGLTHPFDLSKGDCGSTGSLQMAKAYGLGAVFAP